MKNNIRVTSAHPILMSLMADWHIASDVRCAETFGVVSHGTAPFYFCGCIEGNIV